METLEQGWFTVERSGGDTAVISEYRHREETHCYLLCGRERAALIDTGLGVADLRAVVERLTALPVTVLTTHAHLDHMGGHRAFSRIAVHEAEKDWLSGHFPLPLSAVRQQLCAGCCELPPDFSPESYRLYDGGATETLRDGDCIDLGGRMLRVLHTPGHSPGHCCFYEEARRTLYTGDLIYAGQLDAFYPTTDPSAFQQSVRRAQALRAAKLCPGHHDLGIPPTLTDDIAAGFAQLRRQGLLRQGAGRFDFGAFSIRL